jgi:pimeloyl-ACP methyl ester carboxylesterase
VRGVHFGDVACAFCAVAVSTSAQAALGCVTACLEDFRADLTAISIPVLVIHGDQDRVLPYEATGSRLPALLKNTRSTVVAGGPHAIIWTHADEVNQALLDFIGHPAIPQAERDAWKATIRRSCGRRGPAPG